MSDIRVELLIWPTCPSYQPAKNMLLQTMARYGVAASAMRIIEVLTPEQAIDEKFIGSPTIRINGQDIESSEHEPCLACRVYRRRDGQSSALPDPQRLEEAVARALNKHQASEAIASI
jgi:hypothetical protein